LYPVLGPLFKIGAHAAYRKEAILDVLMYMAVNGVTSENGARTFKDEYTKESPSPRTIRYRLGKLEFLEVKSTFLKANKNFYPILKIERNLKSLFYSPLLEALIKEAQKYVEIEAILLDREFFTEPSIKKLEELNVQYLTVQ
jgi:hypothetical protein